MKQSISKNLFYNILYKFITLILPLITIPYVSRVLGADGIGIHSYTLSITQYFVILGTLGLTLYGNRQIAYTRDNIIVMSKTFWTIFLLQIITTGIATIIYIIIFSNSILYKEVYMIQVLNLIAAMADISWLFMGLEDFKKTVTRNLAVKIMAIIFIFIFVNEKNDLYLYVLINALMILLGNISMWLYLPKTLVKVKLSIKDIFAHLKPAIQLFIPQIATQVYVVLDKSMIGFLSDVSQVGYYEQSEKIVKAILAIVTSLGTVMLPRMSNLFAKGDREKMTNYINTSLRGVAYVSVPMTFGIAGISNEFVPWFYGKSFEVVKILIIMLCPIIFFIAMSNVMGTQFLLPSNRIKEYTISVTMGAVMNVALNVLLIPKYKAFGACIATVIAEFSVTAVQYYCLRNEINIKNYLKGLLDYVVASLIMLMVVRLISNIMSVSFSTTVIQSILGAITYISVLIILQEETNIMFFGYIRSKIKKYFLKTQI